LDQLLEASPVFTLVGILTGVLLGGLICYSMFYKYLKRPVEKKTKETTYYPEIEANLEDVIKAVRTYSEKLPKGVYRTILVKDDFSIDFEPLAPILKGIPSQHFYMSKETYDIFEEHEKELPPIIDKVQKAVDQYVKDHKKYPMLPFDPMRRVNYYLLMQDHYLNEMPSIDLYITDYDGLISHHKPKSKQTSD